MEELTRGSLTYVFITKTAYLHKYNCSNEASGTLRFKRSGTSYLMHLNACKLFYSRKYNAFSIAY